jgi:hypothetical protein
MVVNSKPSNMGLTVVAAPARPSERGGAARAALVVEVRAARKLDDGA